MSALAELSPLRAPRRSVLHCLSRRKGRGCGPNDQVGAEAFRLGRDNRRKLKWAVTELDLLADRPMRGSTDERPEVRSISADDSVAIELRRMSAATRVELTSFVCVMA
jgi:hypothetical protein